MTCGSCIIVIAADNDGTVGRHVFPANRDSVREVMMGAVCMAMRGKKILYRMFVFAANPFEEGGVFDIDEDGNIYGVDIPHKKTETP